MRRRFPETVFNILFRSKGSACDGMGELWRYIRLTGVLRYAIIKEYGSYAGLLPAIGGERQSCCFIIRAFCFFPLC